MSMHHPDEEEDEDADEFLSDDAEVGQSKDKTKQKSVYYFPMILTCFEVHMQWDKVCF